jgi:hypothetical protein
MSFGKAQHRQSYLAPEHLTSIHNIHSLSRMTLEYKTTFPLLSVVQSRPNCDYIGV